MEALDLRAERCLFVEVAVDEVTVLLGGDATGAVDADAAGVADHLAHHVFRHLVLVAADREVRVAVHRLLTPASIEQRMP